MAAIDDLIASLRANKSSDLPEPIVAVVDTMIAALQQIQTGVPPAGPAGGNLSGTYPNPTVAKIQGNAVLAGVPGDGQVYKYVLANSRFEAGPVSAIQLQGRDIDTTVPTDGQDLQWSAALNKWSPAFPVTAFGAGYVTGRYYMAPLVTSSGSLAIAANTLYPMPFYVSTTTTWTEIAITVSVAAAAGKLARFGIYRNANGAPSSLVLDCGTVTVDALNQRAVAINQSLTPGWYWLAVFSDSTPTLRTCGATPLWNWLLGNTSPIDGPLVGATAALAFGAMPDPFPALVYNNAGTPQITLRK